MNKPSKPAAGDAVSSAVAVHVAGRRWVSFLRYAATSHQNKSMENLKKLEKREAIERLLKTAKPKLSPYRKAEEIMLARKPCTIVLNGGQHFPIDLITQTSICIVGRHSGYIQVLVAGKEGPVCLDDIQDILE